MTHIITHTTITHRFHLLSHALTPDLRPAADGRRSVNVSRSSSSAAGSSSTAASPKHVWGGSPVPPLTPRPPTPRYWAPEPSNTDSHHRSFLFERLPTGPQPPHPRHHLVPGSPSVSPHLRGAQRQMGRHGDGRERRPQTGPQRLGRSPRPGRRPIQPLRAAATRGFPRKNTLAHVRPVKCLQNIRVLCVIEGVPPPDVTLVM